MNSKAAKRKRTARPKQRLPASLLNTEGSSDTDQAVVIRRAQEPTALVRE